MSKQLHIVSFDVPYPADYGGVIDVFYKLKALKEAGIGIHLHCFAYGRAKSAELNKFCESVHYYERKGYSSAFGLKPFIVSSRSSGELMNRLLKDKHPILLEGLHTCTLLGDDRFRGRRIIYRESNIEHEYYRSLTRSERSFLRSLFFRTEALRLEWFEPVIRHASAVAVVSESDGQALKNRYADLRIEYIPSFHPHSEFYFSDEKEKFLLFHGNLSVAENADAALKLVEVFHGSGLKLVIAGKNPGPEILQFSGKNETDVIANPTHEQLESLIRSAQINVLYTREAAGLKLKLLNVLYNGGQVLLNAEMLAGTGLQHASVIVADPADFPKAAEQLMHTPFGREELKNREEVMRSRYSNKENAEKLIMLLF